LIATNRGDENVICVFVINKIVLYFLKQFKFSHYNLWTTRWL